MRQVVQQLDSGLTRLVEAPTPKANHGSVLIQTNVSLISAGTERMLVGFGKASMIEKARQQPDKVRDVLTKMRTDGVASTLEAVRSKLGQPIPLGYCNVGTVVEVGTGVDSFKVGDRVVSNGAHADMVRIPKNLCAKIPDNVSDEAAAFTVIASIGLQGIRLAQPTLGETFVVTGVGLIGLLTVQLLRLHGCRVLAIDFDDEKLALAQKFGAEICNPGHGADPIATALAFSRGQGIDGVIIAASTQSNEPVKQAAQMLRKRGRIILVGVAGLDIDRADFYEKEISFQVSCSYGPGRYDPSYEEGGNDYPLGFVRWTEKRNFEAILDMMADGRLQTEALVTSRFDFNDAEAAYESLTRDKTGLGLLLNYPTPLPSRMARRVTHALVETTASATANIGVIGAGNYASRVLIPAFKGLDVQLRCISTSGGLSGAIIAEKFGIESAVSDNEMIFSDAEINSVVIATRHDSHAKLAVRALEAGKHVFVEKPLGISDDDINQVERAYQDAAEAGPPPILMVGFNRRFAPQVVKMKSLLDSVHEPKSFIMTMNAGSIPASHWTQIRGIGGGRIVGEACHFIDLMRFLAGSEIVDVKAVSMGRNDSLPIIEDKASITLRFADGSFGTIMYLANGAASFPKERIEVFTAGRILQIDNFRKMSGYNWPGFKKLNLMKQDKGQAACTAAFVDGIKSGRSPIPANEIFEVARASLLARELILAQ